MSDCQSYSTPPPRKVARTPGFLPSLANVFGGQLISALVTLAIELVYARLLGPAGRGQISLCLMVTVICGMLGGLGAELPIVLWTADPKKKLRDWIPSVGLLGIFGATATIGLWSATYWLWHPAFLRGMTGAQAALVAGTIPLTIAYSYLASFFTGLEMSIANRAACLLTFICLAFLAGRDAEAAVLGNLLGLFLAISFGLYFIRDGLAEAWSQSPRYQAVRNAWSLGIRGQLGSVATFFSYRLDVFVVNYFLDSSQVGFYALGVAVSEIIWQIPQAAAVALFPRTVRTLGEGATEFTCFVTRQIFLLGCLLGLILFLISPLAIPLVFGARFSPSVAVIFWILPGTIALAAAKVMSADITARGRPEFNTIVAICGGVTTVGLDFILIPRMGIKGAAIASSVTYMIEGILIALTLKKLLGVKWAELFVPTPSDFRTYRSAWDRLGVQFRQRAL
jgi:O-antigen/teichoic acid export membrane protein